MDASLGIKTLEKAIAHFGGQQALADVAGVTQQAVSSWIKAGKVPAEAAILIERGSRGKFTVRQFRPDLYSTKTN